MKTPTAVALLAILALPLLSGCTSTKELVASIAGPPQRADEKLPEAATLDAEHTRQLYLIVVDRLRRQGSERAALSYLDAYDRQYPADPQARLMRADCLMSIGDGEAAAPVYTELLTSGHRAAASAGLGKVAVARADWEAAHRYFQTAVSLSPSTPEYVNNLAYAQMRSGRTDAALATLRQAQELDPGNVLVRNNMILCLQLSGRGAEAQAMLAAIGSADERRGVSQMLSRFAAGQTSAQLVRN